MKESHFTQTSQTTRKTPAAGVSRRKFVLGGSAAAAAFSIVPRSVLGGPGYVAPSERVTVAYIGCGTQGLRELIAMAKVPGIQIVAACDPVKDGHDYVDWSPDGLRSEIAEALGQPDWRRGAPGIPGGREVAREIVETMEAKRRGVEKFTGCVCYADFRELLEKEDINAVKIMTPDHLHATIAIAAMKKGKHVTMHKPLANRLQEGRWVIETARQTKVATHFIPSSDGSDIRTVKAWIDAGAIGTLREIHNWSSRPMWPQYAAIPSETPAVPEGFDWNLWLGPSTDRPYHPDYTNAVFRGWYEFGGGSLADMGHYSLWPVFRLFDLDSPVSVESRGSHLCTRDGNVAVRMKNDYSFPAACTIRFRFAAKGDRGPLDIFWYDGSIQPPAPPELEGEKGLEPEGMMFVGDKGKILGGFRGEEPHLIPESRRSEYPSFTTPGPRNFEREQRQVIEQWVAACKGGPPTYGDFLLAGPITDAFNLGAISLRLGGKRLLFDAERMEITNNEHANGYLRREYRHGWALQPA
jgi:predicted dehydrogenase